MGFFGEILLKIGFHRSWVSLIMECITTVSYSILVNEEPQGMISPTRGIRQGNHLSPYLFLFCAEGLNSIIRRATDNGDIHGFSICRRGLKLTHLFCVDDYLLFCRSTLEECEKIKELLATYEAVSGYVVNKEKTIFSSAKTQVMLSKKQLRSL